jgi:prepilin-type N-terminal cleavage/methylation domain-containing protein
MARSMTARSSAGRRLSEVVADDSGFTLAEVLVSLGLFVVISVTAMYGLITTLKLTNVTKDRVAAANLATQELERLRSQNETDAQLDSTVRTVTLRGIAFTVTPSLSPAANADCAPGSARSVSVVVTWNSNPARNARYDSVLSC